MLHFLHIPGIKNSLIFFVSFVVWITREITLSVYDNFLHKKMLYTVHSYNHMFVQTSQSEEEEEEARVDEASFQARTGDLS